MNPSKKDFLRLESPRLSKGSHIDMSKSVVVNDSKVDNKIRDIAEKRKGSTSSGALNKVESPEDSSDFELVTNNDSIWV